MFSDFLLENKYNEVEGDYKYNLSSACTPALSLDELLAFYSTQKKEEIQKEIFSLRLDYSEQFGLKKTRGQIAAKIYENISPDEILITSGASEAIFLTMTSLFQKGDKVIVQKPIYQSLFQIVKDLGCEVINWDIKDSIDLDQLESITKKHPDYKALIINNPNNPTGFALEKIELERMSHILNHRLLIADEVFQFTSSTKLNSIIDIHKNSISINDLSKSFSVPGLRLGWIACSKPETLEKLSKQKNYLSLRNSTLSELIAHYVLEKKEAILKRNLKIIEENKKYFFKNLQDLPFEIKNQNIDGLTCLAKTKGDNKLFLEEAFSKGVFVAAGELLGEGIESFTRIGFGLDNQDFQEALKLVSCHAKIAH